MRHDETQAGRARSIRPMTCHRASRLALTAAATVILLAMLGRRPGPSVTAEPPAPAPLDPDALAAIADLTDAVRADLFSRNRPQPTLMLSWPSPTYPNVSPMPYVGDAPPPYLPGGRVISGTSGGVSVAAGTIRLGGHVIDQDGCRYDPVAREAATQEPV